MDKITPIKEKILIFIKHLGITRVEFCENTGISYANLKGRGLESEIGGQQIGKILSLYPELNPEWLLTGSGPMLKSTEDVPHPVVCEKCEEYNKVIRDNNGIPLIPTSAFAGFAAGEQVVLEYECERYVVPMFRDAEFLIPIKGSSMQPKYNSGDIVACKKLPLNDLFFQWNKVYVLDTAQGVLIKRIKMGSDDDHILIVSDNVDYDPFELHKKQLTSIAIVIGVIRLE